MKSSVFPRMVLILIIAAVGFYWFFVGVAQNDEPGILDYLDLFSQVFELVQDNYLEETDPGILAEGAVEGMLLEINPYCYMIPSAESSGLIPAEGPLKSGIILGYKDQLLWALDVIPGSPADEAGILPGDAVIRIGDQVTPALPLFRAQRMLSGKAGDTIKVLIQNHVTYRLDEKTLKLKPFAEPSHSVIRDVHSVAVIHPDGTLTPAGIQEIESRLSDINRDKSVILDLRHVNRGDTETGFALADLFIEDGKIIGKACNAKDAVIREYHSRDGRALTSFPLSVIIDGTTAGPGETCALALAISKRAVITGEHSFGQALIWQRKTLNNRFDIMLVTGDFCFTKDKRITGEGLEPDLHVVLPIATDDDPFLATALSVLTSS